MFGFEGVIEFPAPGDLVMAMHRRHGERFVVHVNVTAQTYRLNPHEREQPLAGLPDRVGLTAKPVIALPAVPVLRPGAREQVWNAFVGFIGLIFVAGGVWMAFTGKTAKDRFVGILGILLFGAAALVSIRDLGRMGAASRNPAANNRYAGIRPRWRVMPYVPLMIVGVELLWIVFVIAVFIFMVGDSRYESTPAKSRLMSAVMGLPAVGGVMLGIVGIIFRWAATKAEWICLILGGVICALFAVGFVWGSFH